MHSVYFIYKGNKIPKYALASIELAKQTSGIKILDNSKKEILESVKKFYKLNIKNYKYNKKEKILHNKFYDILNNQLSRNKDYLKRLGSLKNVQLSLKESASAKFSMHFLKKYKDFLKS